MNSSRLKFREARVDDLQRLLALEQCVVEAERPYNSSIKSESAIYYDLETLISSDDAYLLVVEAENEIIGTGYAQIRNSKVSLEHDQHAYLGFMYVEPQYRGQGLNPKIVEELVLWSKRKGISNFYLDVYAENDSAVRAYEKVGFEPSLMEMKLSIK